MAVRVRPEEVRSHRATLPQRRCRGALNQVWRGVSEGGSSVGAWHYTTRVLGTLGWDDSDRERETVSRLSLANRICATRRVDLPSFPLSSLSLLCSVGPTHSHPSLARSLDARSLLSLAATDRTGERRTTFPRSLSFLGVRCALRYCTAFSA